MIIDVFDPVLCPERTCVQKHIAAKIKWMGSLLVLVSSATFKPKTPHEIFIYMYLLQPRQELIKKNRLNLSNLVA